MNPQAVARVLDANLDRAREGLRVLEEWFRLGLESVNWAAECKDMRQELGGWHHPSLRSARDITTDPGTQLEHPQEQQRRDLEHLLQANCSRVQESLRVLEEYGKLGESRQWLPPTMPQVCKQMRYRLYEMESILLATTLRRRLERAQLYLITSPIEGWLAAVEQALQGGVTLVQYRHKTATPREKLRDLEQLKLLCQRYHALLIVNDHVDLALLVDADGVHLGQTDMPVAAARQLLGSQKLIGQSTTNSQELQAALATSADYVGVGPVYATPTKAGKAPAGLDYVRLAAATVRLPWFAIGGIDADNLPAVCAAGASRVSVVRSLMEAVDPAQTARLMLTQIQSQTTTIPVSGC
ncbi:MAG: thiamine phosphate synthase [Cyanobacteriota bacterium]|nr:thiamine phosphate synthase [Cyanobacteriota bacterium]